jgi:non-lysosomal glucosylceramidase
MELFGPNSWLTGFYLAALKAGAEMADHLGEPGTAADYRALFAKGREWVENHLFNGEYYHQLLDLSDKSTTDSFGAREAYWDEEHREIKHQIGEGCGMDQILAQWHADLCGLGDIFDPKRVRTALRSIFRYNFKRSMRDFYNPSRIYCLNDEAGLVICDWPEGKRKPWTPAPYSSETMNGFEYAAAAHMIQRGMVKQGMQAVAALRARYDGEKRNPWNEFECGSNYARSTASYSLLNAFSGFTFDMSKALIGFDPALAESGRFRCFWSLDSAWGTFEMKPGRVELRVLHGSLEVRSLDLPFLRGRKITGARLGAKKVDFDARAGVIGLAAAARITPGAPLVVRTARPTA